MRWWSAPARLPNASDPPTFCCRFLLCGARIQTLVLVPVVVLVDCTLTWRKLQILALFFAMSPSSSLAAAARPRPCVNVCVWEYVCRAPNSSVSVALSKSYTPFARSCHSGSVVCRSCGCSNARSRHWYSEGLQKKRLCVWSPLKPFPLAHRQSRAPCDMGRQIARTQARIHRALECNVPHAHKEWEGMGALLCPTSDCGFGRVRGGVCSICCHWKSIRSILHHCKCMCVCVFVCVCLWT